MTRNRQTSGLKITLGEVSDDLDYFAESVGLQSATAGRALIAGAIRSGQADRLLQIGLPFAGQVKSRGRDRSHWVQVPREGSKSSDWSRPDGYRVRLYGNANTAARYRTENEGWRLLPPQGPVIRLRAATRIEALDEADLLIRSGRT